MLITITKIFETMAWCLYGLRNNAAAIGSVTAISKRPIKPVKTSGKSAGVSKLLGYGFV